MGGGIPLPRWGTFFLILGVLKPGFGCIIKFKLTSILAPNIYGCSIQGVGGGGGVVSVDTKGGGCGREHPRGRDPFKIMVQNTSFLCIKNKKNSPNFA